MYGNSDRGNPKSLAKLKDLPRVNVTSRVRNPFRPRRRSCSASHCVHIERNLSACVNEDLKVLDAADHHEQVPPML